MKKRLISYIQLLKPRVMSLVIFTSFVGLTISPIKTSLHEILLIILSISLGAGAAGALNMWYESDLDKKMERTKSRPLPMGYVSTLEAFSLGLTLSLISITLLAVNINYLSAALLAFTIFFYAVIYTMILKNRTSQNIVIGGISGALPPVIGWVAVSGYVSIEPLVLFFIIFIWTPPHSWALAICYIDDYKKSSIPMLPAVVGVTKTCDYILFYSITMLPVAMLPYLLNFAGHLYGFVALLASLVFVYKARVLHKLSRTANKIDKKAKDFFGFSIIYLFLLFSLLLADGLFFII